MTLSQIAVLIPLHFAVTVGDLDESDAAFGETPRHEALAAEVVRLTRESDMVERVVVESFDHLAIGAIKRSYSRIRTAALFEPQLTHPISTIRRLRMVDAALAVAADEVALHHTLAAERVIEKARQAGLEVVVWTVEDPSWIRRARALDIKALISNDPGLMVRQRNEA